MYQVLVYELTAPGRDRDDRATVKSPSHEGAAKMLLKKKLSTVLEGTVAHNLK